MINILFLPFAVTSKKRITINIIYLYGQGEYFYVSLIVLFIFFTCPLY